MDNKDKYTIGIRDGYFCYFKNEILHREAGPAVFLIELADKYFYLEDKDLYVSEQQHPTTSITQKEYDLLKSYLFMLQTTHTTTPAYYLEGQEYNKDTWNSLMGKKDLYQELKDELPKNQTCEKKIKI